MMRREKDLLIIRLPQFKLRDKINQIGLIVSLIKENKKLLIIAGIVLLVSAGVVSIKKQRSKTPAGRVSAEAVRKSVSIDKSFTFPGVDNQGRKQGEIELTLTTAEITDEVIVRDQTFRARNNKVFLLINLEMTNDTTKPINLFPGDLIRLTYDGSDDKKYSPDLHNNLVLISPISTKSDRVGFVIPAAAKNLKIQVGELEGEKEVVDLQFDS